MSPRVSHNRTLMNFRGTQLLWPMAAICCFTGPPRAAVAPLPNRGDYRRVGSSLPVTVVTPFHLGLILPGTAGAVPPIYFRIANSNDRFALAAFCRQSTVEQVARIECMRGGGNVAGPDAQKQKWSENQRANYELPVGTKVVVKIFPMRQGRLLIHKKSHPPLMKPDQIPNPGKIFMIQVYYSLSLLTSIHTLFSLAAEIKRHLVLI